MVSASTAAFDRESELKVFDETKAGVNKYPKFYRKVCLVCCLSRDIMMEYSKQVTKLGELLFELLFEALGLKPSHLKDMDCVKGLLMLGHYYPPCPQPDLTLGTSKNSFNDLLTVLLQDHIGGLQVLHED